MARNEVLPDNWLPCDDAAFIFDIPLTVLEHFNWSPPENGAAVQDQLDNRLDKLHVNLVDDGNLVGRCFGFEVNEFSSIS